MTARQDFVASAGPTGARGASIDNPLVRRFGALRRWVLWRLEKKDDGKLAKVCYQPNGKKAASTRPAEWSTFAQVNEKQNGYEGVGLTFADDRLLLGIDCDHVVDSGEVTNTRTRALIDAAQTYVELSPSATGLHLFLALTDSLELSAHKKESFEVYNSGRYFTFTGKPFGEMRDVRTVTPVEALDLLALIGYPWSTPRPDRPAHPTQAEPIALDDHALIHKIIASKHGDDFDRLWRGISPDAKADGSPDESRADMRLVCRLVWWTGRDAARTERLWLASGLGRRDKVQQRADYRLRTIEAALMIVPGQYDPTTRAPMPAVVVPDGMEEDPNADAATDGKPQRRPIEDSPIDLPQTLRDLPLTDAGNAEAFELIHGASFRFCHTRRIWLTWDSGRWTIDANGAAERAMLHTVRQRLSAGMAIADIDRKKRHCSYCLTCENAKKIADGLKSALTRERLSATIGDFDCDPLALCVGDMAVDLTTGTARPATPDDMFSQRAGAIYDPGATAPRWERFLNEVFPGDPAMLIYLRWLAGYWLTGSKAVQAYWMLQGEGANGKTRFLGAMMRAWGDYAKTTGFNTFDADKHEDKGDDLAELRAARLVFASEVDEDRPLAEARMKAIAGGDPITCRHLYGRFFTYQPAFKPVLAVNVLPIVRGQDHGTWRRIRVIRFCQTFDPTVEPTLETTLSNEAAGILNWAISGARDFLKAGGAFLPEPASVRDWADAYRTESDTMGRWLAECVTAMPGAFTASRALYSSYVMWCIDAGHKPKSRTGWARDLARKYPTAYRDTVRPRGYDGLGLLAREDHGAPYAPDKPVIYPNFSTRG